MKFNGYFGSFGGIFVPETLMPALEQLEDAFLKLKEDKKFNLELNELLEKYKTSIPCKSALSTHLFSFALSLFSPQ